MLVSRQTALTLTASVLFLALTGCHGDTQQGGGTSGHSSARNPPNANAGQQPVPTPPSADQISPDSPQAVLNGTSVTHPAARQPQQQQPSNTHPTPANPQ